MFPARRQGLRQAQELSLDWVWCWLAFGVEPGLVRPASAAGTDFGAAGRAHDLHHAQREGSTSHL